MRITVFGATGKVGRLVVEEALSRGHEVIAYQRRPDKLSDSPMLTVCVGDIYDADKVAAAVSGSDTVISALGSWGTPRKDVLATAMQHIIPAMQQSGIKRIVSLTGADARTAGDQIGMIHKLTYPMLGKFAGKILRDGEQHIALLAKSSLDWTVIRSPIMRNWGSPAPYKLGKIRPAPWSTVNRQAVAKSMVDQVEQASHLCYAPFISAK